MINFLRRFFRNEVSLDRIRDTVDFVEGKDRLTLYIDDDATRLGRRILAAQRKVADLPNNADDEAVKEAAIALTAAVFGEEQTEKILAFYHNDYFAVLSITGKYFTEKLGKKITAKQKRRK